MSERLPRDGVQLVVEGERQFIASLQRVNNAWQATVQGFDSAGKATSKVTMSLGTMQTAEAKTATSTTSLVTAWSTAIQAFDVAVKYINKAVSALAKLGEGIFKLAVRASELQAISMQFAILNQNVEGGSQAMLRAMQEASAGMISTRNLMTSFNDAAALVNVQFAQRLPEALSLLGKVSAATGTDLNYLLESLVRGVGRVSPLILDNLKIQVGVAEATAKASEMFGKEADQLTKVEQQTALTELALSKLEAKFGALPDTTKTLASQTAVLQANFQNIGDTLGQYVVPGMTTLVESVNKVVGAFAAAISEGGALEPILVSVGAWFSILADGAASFADKAVKAFEGLTGEMSMGIADTIEQALRWGVELVAAFAEGIVEATTTVLVTAMNAISNMLTSWLLGGSPPKVAPNIVQWGIALMQQYLEGMTQADFGILKQIQGPLKKILEGPAFAGVSKALAGALAGGDRGQFLEAVSRAAGVFGESIRKLAEAQFDLADAVTAVEVAENALARSREKVTDSQAEVNRQTEEYNRLLRAGATRGELDAQLKLINVAEANLQTAMDQVDTQEAAVQAAKDRKAQLETEAKLQQDVVDQLLGINDALSEQEKAKERAAKGKAGAAGAVPEIPEVLGIPSGLDIGGRIGEAIDKMKEQLKEKFKDIFKPLGDAWNNISYIIRVKLADAWDEFKKKVGEAWDKLKEKYPFLQTVENWVLSLPKNTDEAAAAWETFKDRVGTAWDNLKERWPFLEDVEAWTKNVPQRIYWNADAWEDFKDRVGKAWDELEQKYPTLKKIRIWIDYMPQRVDALSNKISTYLTTAFQKLADKIAGPEDSLLTRWKELWDFLKTDFWPWVRDTLWQKLVKFADEVVTPLEKAVGKLADSFQWWYDKIVQLASQAVTDALEQINRLLDFVTGHSPSPLEKGLKGVNQQLQVLATTRLPSIASMGPQMQRALAPTQMLSPVSNTNVTMNMGGNNFYGGQDDAAFDARVQQSLRRTLQRR